MKRMLKGVEIKVTEEAWEDFLWSWFPKHRVIFQGPMTLHLQQEKSTDLSESDQLNFCLSFTFKILENGLKMLAFIMLISL